MKQLSLFSILFFLMALQVSTAQDTKNAAEIKSTPETKTMKEVTVTDFDSPFDEISVAADGDEETDEDFVLNDKVKFSNKKGDPIKKEEIVEGSEVTVIYIEEGAQKTVTEIKLLTVAETGKVKYVGLLDGFTNGLGIVGGLKIKLDENVVINGKGKETYKSFDDPRIIMGSKVTVKGKKQADGSILAKEVDLEEVEITKSDKKFMEFSRTRFNGTDLSTFTKEKGQASTAVKDQNTYKGNLKIGDVSYTLVNDMNAQGLISDIGDKLLPAYVKEEKWQKAHPEVEFIFYLVQDEVPNAYAMPDGKVFVHTGLLKVAENSAQIAFVMSHEITHVLYKHGTAKFVKSQKTQSLVNGVAKVGKVAGNTFRALGFTGRKPTTAETAQIAGNVAGGNALVQTSVKAATIMTAAAIEHFKKGEFTNVFSKQKEAEADRVALYYTQAAGYDIREVPKFWLNMMEINSDPGYIENLGTSLKSSLAKNLNTDDNADLSTQILTVGTEALFNGSFNSVYISHPLSRKRLSATKKALTSTYQSTDYTKAVIDKEEYQNTVKRLK